MGKLVDLVLTSGAMKALAPPGQVKGGKVKVVELEMTDNSDSEEGVLDSGRHSRSGVECRHSLVKSKITPHPQPVLEYGA